MFQKLLGMLEGYLKEGIEHRASVTQDFLKPTSIVHVKIHPDD